MAWNPNFYNPYGFQQSQNANWQYYPNSAPQQAVNGLSFIDSVNDLDTLKMPPGSTSQPYFLKDEAKFVIVSFDNVGGSTKELYTFEKAPMSSGIDGGEFVTREYFDQQIGNIMEAINGKSAVSETEKTGKSATSPDNGTVTAG